MSYPARGPTGTMGIDGKANAASRRRTVRSNTTFMEEAAK